MGRPRERLAPELKLVSAFLIILLVSLSRGAFFLELAAALEFGCLCLLPARTIARILKKVIVAALFAFLIFLPAFLVGRSPNTLLVCGKVLLAVLAAALFSAITPWPSVSAALSSLRVPDVFIMTLDMTVKYISLLGGLALDMLYALRLRSVGRDASKMSSLAGIAGSLFLKSRDAAETQYEAMECRCFSGTYRLKRHTRPTWRDAAFVLLDLVVIATYIAFGRAA